MKLFLLFNFFIFNLLYISCNGNNPTDFVNPFIGSGGHGHTYPGATLPFGMVQLSPDTRLEGWDGCSGYHYSDSVIYGFSHTHLSGTGIADYCDILLMPVSGRFYLQNGYKSGVDNGYASRFAKKTEQATPGWYAVRLKDYGITVELTATRRVGLHKYIFPEDKKAFVILDLTHRDETLESNFRQVNAYEIEGLRRSRSWAKNQVIYFVARFNQPVNKLILAINDTVKPELNAASSRNIKAVLDFGRCQGGEPLLVKVGISAVDIAGARGNLQAELPGWNFDSVKAAARTEWNRELEKIEIEADDTTKTIFYTALYHTMLAPNLFMDTDGRYRGTDFKIHRAEDFTNYTVFSLWDTYRAAHPLYSIIDQKRSNDFIRTFLQQYENGGQLPVWELAANYTGTMIGYHAVSVITDAYVKGIRNYDVQKAYRAMKHSAMLDHLGLNSYKRYGYIPAHLESESVSKTLEYAYDDWCLAQMAKDLGESEDYKYFLQRAQSYKNIYDPISGFMRPKMHGAWKYPFEPAEVDFNYTEANAWQYSFSVPQDVSGLMALMGGEERFAAKLDSLFSAGPQTSGRKQPDITGMIGQYAHGNEPSHHMAYLYSYAGRPWKTQAMVRRIMDEMYSTRPDGYIGNEDCGQMSAWYVLSALGFYPLTPGSDNYVIGSPILPKAILHLENGSVFTIISENPSPGNPYIQSVRLNGKPYEKSYLSHQTLMQGGELLFVMGADPNKKWGTGQYERPLSRIDEHLILPLPYSDVKKRLFDGTVTVRLFHADSAAQIYYATDNAQRGFKLYKVPLKVDKTTTIYFYARKGALKSNTETMELIRFPKGRSITLFTRPGSQYTAGSDSALIDGLFGGNDFRNGSWQGYERVDLQAVIDLGKAQTMSYLSANFLQDINSWIFMPLYVEFYASGDGKHFRKLGRVANMLAENQWGSIVRDFFLRIKPQKMRYVKVIGKNRGFCPAWHKGRGGKAWIFIDEITIR